MEAKEGEALVPYYLQVQFRSNERPWSTRYEPPSWMQPKTRDDAIAWATGMKRQLDAYTVDLMEDGARIELPEENPDAR